MLKVKIKAQDNGKLGNIVRLARKFKGGVEVGYWSRQGSHDGKSPITLGDLASIHEHGSKHIPKRPFVLPALQQNRQNYAKHLQHQITPVLLQKQSINTVWQTLGQKAVQDVQKYMVTATFTPLSPATIANRRRRSVGSTKPLIDRGHLKGSVSYEVKR